MTILNRKFLFDFEEEFIENEIIPFKKPGQTFVALDRQLTRAGFRRRDDPIEEVFRTYSSLQQGIEGYMQETNTGVSLKQPITLIWETLLNRITEGVLQIRKAVDRGAIEIEMLPCEIFVEARQFTAAHIRVTRLYQHIGPLIGGIYIRWNNGWTDINSRSPRR